MEKIVTTHATVATWNLQWASPAMARGKRAQSVLDDQHLDVLVATEATLGVLPPDGHVIDAGTDWGYSLKDPARRKVVLWSKQPWDEVDAIGDEALPGGRWVAGTTATPIGLLRVVGVCIPWKDAHVRTGRRDRMAWEDHAAYLAHLGALLRSQSRPILVAGDFNQTVPRRRQRLDVATALTESLEGLTLWTGDPRSGGTQEEREEVRLIDHVATTPDLAVTIESLLRKRDDHGPLSDHTGVVVTVRRYK
ncbi:MAG: endonuclease/exonuclease/phosphatase family protein [Acidimicrobiales bacterium]